MKSNKALYKIAVVRGAHPRMTEANFYSHFSRFKVRLIGDKKTGWIAEEKVPPQIESVDLFLKPVWRFDPWTSFFKQRYVHRSWQFLDGLERQIRDCEVVNISDLFYFYCWQSAQIAERLRKKLVVIVWENVVHHLSTYLPPYCFGVRKVLQTADLFIARSKKAREYLLSVGAEDRKIKVVYKGIDLSVFKPRSICSRFDSQGDSIATRHAPGEALQNDNVVRILYVGQLVKSKGILELASAFERLCQEFDNLELTILGRSDGEPLEVKIRNLAKKLPIILKSRVEYNELPEIYQKADIYCQLSQDWRYLGLVKGGNDWFPYAVLEAMASGLPVVATSVGGIPEQLGKGGNIFVKQKDVGSTYQALKRFILNKKLREKVGAKNRKRAEKMFEIKKQARKTEEEILKIIPNI